MLVILGHQVLRWLVFTSRAQYDVRTEAECLLPEIYCIEKLAGLQNYPVAIAQNYLWLLQLVCNFETKIVWNHHRGLLVKL